MFGAGKIWQPWFRQRKKVVKNLHSCTLRLPVNSTADQLANLDWKMTHRQCDQIGRIFALCTILMLGAIF
jgi:hypothetical protein